MASFLVLLRKELGAALLSPIASTVSFVFLLVLGYTFSLTLFATKVANLNYIFHQMYVLSVLLVPLLTSRRPPSMLITNSASFRLWVCT